MPFTVYKMNQATTPDEPIPIGLQSNNELYEMMKNAPTP
jgi:hypothetical protein